MRPHVDKANTTVSICENKKMVDNFHNTTTPNFTKNPLKKIENSVDASTWAFNNHEVKGHMGILTAKPKTKRTKPKYSIVDFVRKFVAIVIDDT